MSRGRGFPRRWFCSGCGKDHPLSREIEGVDYARKWCGHSIRRAAKERRNDVPDTFRAYREFQDAAAR
jgi:hypothetical protein